MIKNNKLKTLISSIIILIPILFGLIFWNELPYTMTTHWGADGVADGFGSKAFAVFLLPLILLVVHIVMLLVSTLDKNHKNQNKKAMGIIFWIIPFVSLFTNGIIYSIAFEKEFGFELLTPIFFGALFILIGNYMPKVVQNKTLGIKIYWTLGNEENWNKTHRLGGKLWVIGGIAMLFCIFLPLKIMATALLIITFAMIIVPMVYSYSIYRKHKKEGVVYTRVVTGKGEKIAVKISAVLVPLILVGTMVLMFTGDINIDYDDDSFEIEASYYDDIEIDYSDIDNIEYRENYDAGIRTYGFASARLSMGNFKNDEFGNYTRYAYTRCKSCVILESNGKVLIINGKNTADTKKIFNLLSSKIS